MKKFTKECVDEQIEKFHDSTNDEWLTECWNNYGLALEFMNRLYDDLHMHELWHRTYKDENIELRQKINDFQAEHNTSNEIISTNDDSIDFYIGYPHYYTSKRQALMGTIEDKNAEIGRLKKSLRDIFDLTHNKQRIRLIDALYDIDQIIKNTLEEELI